MLLYLSLFPLSIIAALIHLYFSKVPRTPARIVEILLLYQLVISVGIVSLFSFYGMAFMSQMVADYTNWPASPFETQVANVNLAFSVLGFLSIWIRGHFWTATIIGISVWLIGDGTQHLLDVLINHNYAPGNAGAPLFIDFLSPLVLLVLLAFYLKLNAKDLAFHKSK
jgi:hypothetical protein